VYSNVNTNKSTSQSSNNVSKSTSSKETDDADVKLLTGTASDTEGTDVETEDDSSGEIVEDNANEQVPVLKDNIKKDKEAPKTADKLKTAIVVLMLIVALGIIIMLCIMNRNDVSKEEIKTGFGENTSTN
jgi:preprotein translocase subunit SecF